MLRSCCAVMGGVLLLTAWGQPAERLEKLQEALRWEAERIPWMAERALPPQPPSLPLTVWELAAMARVRSLAQQGRWEDSRAEALEFLQRYTLSALRPWMWTALGVAEFVLREFPRAEAAWDSARATLPTGEPLREQVEYWRLLAILQQGHYQRADHELQQYAERYPAAESADEALWLRALVLESLGNIPQAAQLLELLRQRYPCRNTLAQALARQAYLRLLERRAVEALELLEHLQLHLERFREGNPPGCQPPDEPQLARQELLYIRGEAYILLERWDAAWNVFDTLARQFPDAPLAQRARLQQGWILLRRGSTADALQRFDELRTSPQQEIAELAELYGAIARKRLGDTAAARQQLLELSLRPHSRWSARALLELGQLAYEQRRYQSAQLFLEQARREAADLPTLLTAVLLLGESLYQQQQWREAVRLFQTAEQLLATADSLQLPNPHRYREYALLGLGRSLLALGQPEAALPLLQRLWAEYRDRALQGDEILFWLAEAHYRVGELAQATEAYEQVLLRYPQSARREEALYSIGWCAFRLQQLERAVFWFERLIQEFPQSRFAAEALLRSADALYMLGQYRRAAEQYHELSRRFPNTPYAEYAAYQYGYVLYRLREYSAAEQAFRTFARAYPNSPLAPEALYMLAWIAFQQRNYEAALERLRGLLATQPSPEIAARAWFAIGNAYYNMGRWEDALAAYRTVVERYPNSPFAAEAVQSVQYTLVMLGRSEEAYRWADTIAQRFPATRLEQEARLRRAELLFAEQRYRDALQEYREFVRRYPYNERTPEALLWALRSAIALADEPSAAELLEQLRRTYPQSSQTLQGMLEYAHWKARVDPRTADSLYGVVAAAGDSLTAAEALLHRGLLAYSRADTLRMVMELQRLIALYPQTEFAAQARLQLALYWRAREAYDSVRSVLAPLIAREDALGAEALYRFGEAWMRQRQYDSAARAFEQLRLSHRGREDWYSLGLLQLGECYEQLGRPEAAAEVYRVLLNLRPGDEFGKTAQARLNRLPRRRP
jgi:outer membrane assembly lipoprotein YfiO